MIKNDYIWSCLLFRGTPQSPVHWAICPNYIDEAEIHQHATIAHFVLEKLESKMKAEAEYELLKMHLVE
jgi:hypothetical protein